MTQKLDEMTGAGKPWKTPSGFWSWLRGNLRRALWKNHPVKLDFLRKRRYKYGLGKKTKKNPNGMIWVSKCEMCENRFPMGQVEVDHKEASGSLLKITDILPFILKLAFVTEEDLRILCKKCHKLVTLSQRSGLPLEEARKEQRLINYMKLSIAEQKALLVEKGFDGDEISNASKRKQLFRRIIENDNTEHTEG